MDVKFLSLVLTLHEIFILALFFFIMLAMVILDNLGIPNTESVK